MIALFIIAGILLTAAFAIGVYREWTMPMEWVGPFEVEGVKMYYLVPGFKDPK